MNDKASIDKALNNNVYALRIRPKIKFAILILVLHARVV
jgi:hypothetical protein